MLACYNTTMQLIPAVDLLGDFAVRLDRGDYDRVIFRHPLNDFIERIVATGPPMIHVVDLDGARSGLARLDLVGRCIALAGSIPVQVSGGLRSVESATRALDAGAERVIIGSAAWATPDALGLYADALGDRLLVALDTRDARISVQGWLADGGLGIADALSRCVDAGVTRVHVTAIDRDGTMRGPDLALYALACSSGLAVVAAGGVRDDADVAALAEVGCEAAIMGVGYLARLGLTTTDYD